VRPRLSADQFVPLSPNGRDNPFTNVPPLPPLPNFRHLDGAKKPSGLLSHAPSTASSASAHDFSRSLPIGAMRVIHGPAAVGSADIMSTPKPEDGALYQKAFMSTGLVSKVSRNPELIEDGKKQAVPDTPCKKPTLLFNTFPPTQGSVPKQSSVSSLADATVDSPAATTKKRLSLFKDPRSSRRNLLFDACGSGDDWESGDHRQGSSPPTPTKPQSCNLFDTPSIRRTSDMFLPASSTRKSLGQIAAAISAPAASSAAPATAVPDSASIKIEFSADHDSKTQQGVATVQATDTGGSSSSSMSFLGVLTTRKAARRPSPLRMSSTEPCTGTSGGGPEAPESGDDVDPAKTPTGRGLIAGQRSPHTPSNGHLLAPLGAQEPPSTVDIGTSPTLRVPSSVQTAVPTTPSARDFLRSSLATPGNLRGDLDMDSTLVKRFSKVEQVGKGQFSTVYRVTAARRRAGSNEGNNIFPARRRTPAKGSLFFYPTADRVYAVKKTRDAYRSNADRLAKYTEVRVLEKLKHSRHVIRFVDSWEDKGHLYIQTEFCEEGNLGSFLEEIGRTGRLDDFRIWKILQEITLGLKSVHDNSFVHLDMKPTNVLITFNGVLKIADFGLAQEWPVPANADIEGDRVYLAPEALESSSAVWSATDIYSVGMMLVEIACNINLPQNGASWQALRRDCFDEVPTLTLLSATQPHFDSQGLAVQPRLSDLATNFGDRKHRRYKTAGTDDNDGDDGEDDDEDDLPTPTHADFAPKRDILEIPPDFMSDARHPASLDHLYKWMLARDPLRRPTAQDILETEGMMWVNARRQSPATVYEGKFGPGDNGPAFPKVVEPTGNDCDDEDSEMSENEGWGESEDHDTTMGGL
jgi:mitosis inhibitor protein kinase SWE1